MHFETLDKDAIVMQGATFDQFFKKSARRQGQSIAEYISEKERVWEDLRERDGEKYEQRFDGLFPLGRRKLEGGTSQRNSVGVWKHI